MTWSSAEITAIAAADELDIAPARPGGDLRRPVPVWVVRDGSDLYVRSWRGNDGAWFRAAVASGTGEISAAGVTRSVTFASAGDEALNERIDAAYQAKYQRYGDGYVGPMVAGPARATTLRLTPQ